MHVVQDLSANSKENCLQSDFAWPGAGTRATFSNSLQMTLNFCNAAEAQAIAGNTGLLH